MNLDFDHCRYKAAMMLGPSTFRVFSTQVHPASEGRWAWVDRTGRIYCFCDQSQEFPVHAVEVCSDEEGLAFDRYLVFAFDEDDDAARGCAQHGRASGGGGGCE